MRPNKPNILWICTDQQRWDTLSCLGFPGANTPHIDSIASRGVVFKNTYCQSPVCTPSRASFLTGTYPISNQVQQNGNEFFPANQPLVTKILADGGYHAGLVGKLHLSNTQFNPEERPDDGYSEFYWSRGRLFAGRDNAKHNDYHLWIADKGEDPEKLFTTDGCVSDIGVPAKLHQTAWAEERSRDYISKHRHHPWLLSVNVFDPHPPFFAPPEYEAQFDANDMPQALFRESDIEHQERLSGVDHQTRTAIVPDDFINQMAGGNSSAADGKTPAGGHDKPPTQFNSRRVRATYHAMIKQVDDMVGGIVQELEETGQLDNTIIIFTSDHGEMLGDHGLMYKGCRFYEGLVHVPLIVSYPAAIKGGSKSDALVELVDIAPTLLDLAGLETPEHMQGKTLGPLLRGETNIDKHKPFVLSEYYESLRFDGCRGSRGSMYFDGRYKLNVYHDVGEGEMFDLANDPSEFDDLWHSESHTELKSSLLLKHLNAMMLKSGKGPPRVADF